MAAPVRFLVLMVVTVALPMAARGELTVGFYQETCPSAETLVQQAVASAFSQEPGIAPGLVRAHFHDCFVRGCDASVLLDGEDSEKTAIPNLTLRGLEVIDEAKENIEAACPGVVSCADILAFAARDSSALAGNITWEVPAGRRDSFDSFSNETSDLPQSNFNSSELVDSFAKKGLTADEMVTLSGAHSFGRSHCPAFRSRLFDENGTVIDDPTISSAYATLLRLICPFTADNDVTVKMDIITPDVLDNRYYVGVLNNLGLFTSDHALVTDPALLEAVQNNSADADGWAGRFRNAMVKMGNIEVLEGTEGEIRTNCRVVNSPSSESKWSVETCPTGKPGLATS